jgi:cation diffusion facilitator CzcD-associated flavoprotein CzcO
MSPRVERVSTVIVGGGPAGIATAAALGRRRLDAIVLEKGDSVAPAWRHHYDRLHLHTPKKISGLPGEPMPKHYPKYPSRDQVFEYLSGYSNNHGVKTRLRTEVALCRRQGDRWDLVTSQGTNLEAVNVVIATGLSQLPRLPWYPNQDSYEGDILHSAEYRNGEPYRGKHVLVVGFGNSAGEIALDLVEHGAHPHMSVRGPSVVVPRDIAGVPILTLARLMSVFPPKAGDLLSKPLLAVSLGNLSALGLPLAKWGPLEQIATQGKIPMLDVGTVATIRSGAIKTRPGIDRFTDTGVIFSGGRSEPFDAVIFATGFDAGVDRILEITEGLLDEEGRPLASGDVTAERGLYFCGFREPPTGRLRQIGIEAERIGDMIAADVGSARAGP